MDRSIHNFLRLIPKKKYLTDVERIDIEDFKRLRQTEVSYKWTQSEVYHLRSFFKWAIEHTGLDMINPAVPFYKMLEEPKDYSNSTRYF